MIQVQLDQKAIDRFCVRNHIRRLALFGSALRDDFTSRSDVDVLVEFQIGHVPGLHFFALQEELSSLFGRKVDLHTSASLSKYFRDAVLKEARVIYEQT